MNLTSLTSAQFKQIVKLLREREVLQARLDKVDAGLAEYDSVTGGLVTRAARRGTGPRRPRGTLKEAIVELVRGAGKGGITVKEISAHLKLSPNNVYTWFYSTGKKMKEIKKVGEARYAWGA